MDDGKGQENATPPHVRSGPDRSPSIADVDGMVESAEDGLEHEGGDDGQANDGVVLADLYVFELASCGEPGLCMRCKDDGYL